MSGNTEATDIRLITLKRKNVGIHSGETHSGEKKRSKGDGSRQNYFATDYFDLMSVTKKSIENDLTEIMGVCPDEEENNETAVQSFVLYSNSCLHQSGSPFDVQENEQQRAPFLSVIQIHITPEILAYLELSNDREAADIFMEDISALVSAWEGAHEEKGSFTYKIYQLLSAGDFAVVIRSRRAKDAFAVSTRIRKRAVKVEENGKEIRLVLYKTYTLFTIDGCVIEVSADEEAEHKGQFVLRGCYSNVYWSNKETVLNDIAQMHIDTKSFYGLNGRYDFSVQLDVKDFRILFPRLKNYKFPEDVSGEMGLPEGCSDEVQYLWYLMDKGYLSYINERYLLDADDIQDTNDENKKENISEVIKLKRGSNEPFLDENISKRCEEVLNKYRKLKEAMADIKGYRKNMDYYTSLLGKLIRLCQTINILSDTRIYAVFLLEQLEIVIDSMDVYVKLLKEDDTDLLDLINEDLRVSVYTLDCYANYIRNNNLQSVQTPNYNIESKVSMEKMLIGYSEFLKCLMDLYLDYRENKENKMKDSADTALNRYFPIVVPDLGKEEVSVEIMFPEGNGTDGEEEEKIRNKKVNGRRYLLVITTPTLYDLNCTKNLSVSLFHEIAHQFRYESREERNKVLLDYVLERECDGIVYSVLDGINRKTERHVCNEIQAYICSALKKAIKDNFFKGTNKQSLNRFLRFIQGEMGIILREDKTKAEIETVFRRFMSKINEYVDIENESAVSAVRMLKELKEEWLKALAEQAKNPVKAGREEELEKLKELVKLEQRMVNCAFVSAFLCSEGEKEIGGLPKNVNHMIERQEAENQIAKWCEDTDQDWNNLDEYIPEADLRAAYSKFAEWIYAYKLEDLRLGKDDARNSALDASYAELCEVWRTRTAALQDEDSEEKLLEWAETGRYLGIDWEGERNKKQYRNIISQNMTKAADNIIEDIARAVMYYREETADIFMCELVQLSDFGYLNLMAENLPNNGDIFTRFEERIINVFCVLYCTESIDGKEDIKVERLCNACGRIIDKICDDIKSMLEEYDLKEETVSKLNQITAGKDPDVWKSQNLKGVEILDDLEEWAGDAALDKKLRTETADLLKRYRTIIQMVRILYERGDEYISRLGQYEELKKDLLRGREEIKDFREKLKVFGDQTKDAEEQREQTDELRISAKKINQYCEGLRDMMEEPYQNLSGEKRSGFHKMSIEFFLSMYYLNKTQCAGMLKEKNNENTNI